MIVEIPTVQTDEALSSPHGLNDNRHSFYVLGETHDRRVLVARTIESWKQHMRELTRRQRIARENDREGLVLILDEDLREIERAVGAVQPDGLHIPRAVKVHYVSAEDIIL